MPVISFQRISKSFPGVRALTDVSFAIAPGTCHALCGENGAGKSTLGKILAGVYSADSGDILIDGHVTRFSGSKQARAAGIALVHQELSFCNNLTVAENICLSALPTRGPFVSRRLMRERAFQVLGTIGAAVDPDQLMGDLPIAQQQLVQIAGAVDLGARVIVFDEPTSSLSQHEAERLYALIDLLKGRAVTTVYVSHRLEEIFRLCDAVTVLRDGQHVATRPIGAFTRESVIEMMIGRPLKAYFPAHLNAVPGEERLRVETLSSPVGITDVSFSVRAGEIIGLAGLVGSGRSEVARAVFGLDRHAQGRIWINGHLLKKRSAAEAIRLGVGLAPEDRKVQGLVLVLSALENSSMAILPRIAWLGLVSRGQELRSVTPFFERLGFPKARVQSPVLTLSGGNQQKVVLAKWLAARCPVLILDEPTRGIDVGAKAEIHEMIDKLATAGTAIVLISSELPEIVNLSTRVLVFREGRIAGHVPRAQVKQELLMKLMSGV